MTRRWGRLRAAPVLFIVLAITTGWAQVAPPAQTAHVLSRQLPADVASSPRSTAGPSLESSGGARRPQAERVELPTTTEQSVPQSAPLAYVGRNHFWIPALGVSRDVYSYPCSRTRAPANLIYRWGCAGANNVYILGHAYGVMAPLHDAYVSGRLHVGMVAIYADANGTIRSYQVTSWRLVRPTNGTWAEASQPVPSMTLQTCVGARSQWRLIVRLVATD